VGRIARGDGRELGERFFDLDPRVPDIAKASMGFPLKTAAQKIPNRNRHVLGKGSPIGIACQDGGDDVRDRLAGEGLPSCEDFVQHPAERPDVRLPVESLAPCLLRARCLLG